MSKPCFDKATVAAAVPRPTSLTTADEKEERKKQPKWISKNVGIHLCRWQCGSMPRKMCHAARIITIAITIIRLSIFRIYSRWRRVGRRWRWRWWKWWFSWNFIKYLFRLIEVERRVNTIVTGARRKPIWSGTWLAVCDVRVVWTSDRMDHCWTFCTFCVQA